MLEVSSDREAESGTISPTAKEGSNAGIGENYDMASIDAAPDVVDLSKASESTSSKIKERGEGVEETSSPIIDAVPVTGVVNTHGKATPSKSSMMKQKRTPVKKSMVVTALLPKSTATKQK